VAVLGSAQVDRINKPNKRTRPKNKGMILFLLWGNIFPLLFFRWWDISFISGYFINLEPFNKNRK